MPTLGKTPAWVARRTKAERVKRWIALDRGRNKLVAEAAAKSSPAEPAALGAIYFDVPLVRVRCDPAPPGRLECDGHAGPAA